MDFAWSPEDLAFKEELEAFLDKEMPPFIEQWSDNEDPDAEDPNASRGVMGVMDKRKAWQNKLNEGRWAAILWPEEWGGRDATTAQQVIYTQVMAKYRSPGIFNANGIVQIGPSIITWGTDDQKARWLPAILDASEHWCQGFSEPQAGSDLANLRTTAILSDDGTHYVVNGQKTWISSAQIAKWGLFLMRTDPTAIARGVKHDGITTFIVDMELPGIDVRPIREITGDSLFCEVFFTDAKIPAGDRLGDEGNGWLVSMSALGKERVGSAGQAISMAQDLRALLQTARAENPDALRDPAIRERVAKLHIQIEATRLLIARALSKVLKGEKGWPEVPLAKLQWGYISLWLAELALDVLGPTGTLLKGAPGAIDGGMWARNYVWQRYTTIGAGPTEVQKNIIADRALKLER
ncbi:MAG TPA: acyl-CoA dehydrogenase family protein [Acidimicrobiia bacterium]|nr:acyl-CoA dehydrogenase family protein [Acidimicrobiia bacterium]